MGPKGQVVIAKEWRQKYGITEGSIVEQVAVGEGVLLVVPKVDELLKSLDETAERVGKAWPKELTAVDAVRADRGRE